MKLIYRVLLLPLLALFTIVTIATSASSANPGIRIGSKDWAEQFILGEMYALVLENAGFQVERQFNMGGTPILHRALVNGVIDLYPEYTGTGLLTVLGMSPSTDPQEVYELVSEGYQERFNLVWLTSAPMNNSQAFAMTQDGVAKFGIRTISDMVRQASELVMIGSPYFLEREDGLSRLRAAYGDFELKNYLAVDPGLRYIGLTKGEADVAVAFATDGEISALNLILLEDDRRFFIPYQIAPVVRQEILSANPRIAEALNALAPRITTESMQRLNYGSRSGDW